MHRNFNGDRNLHEQYQDLIKNSQDEVCNDDVADVRVEPFMSGINPPKQGSVFEETDQV